MFSYSYKWDPDVIVKSLLYISESNNESFQRILTDLLTSLIILLSGESNCQFDQHIQIIKQFLTQVWVLNIIFLYYKLIYIFSQSSTIIIKNQEAWVYLKNLKYSPLLSKSIIQKIFNVILKNMLTTDVDFHLDIAYEQYRLYKTPDYLYDMLELVFFS